MEDNAAVEIHDSTLERIEHEGDDIVAVFSAYVHRSAGRPGIDAGSGWSQALHLRFGEDSRVAMWKRFRWSCSMAILSCRVRDSRT
jgi:hypothetical protein